MISNQIWTSAAVERLYLPHCFHGMPFQNSEIVEASKRCLPILLVVVYANQNLTYTAKKGSRVSS